MDINQDDIKKNEIKTEMATTVSSDPDNSNKKRKTISFFAKFLISLIPSSFVVYYILSEITSNHNRGFAGILIYFYVFISPIFIIVIALIIAGIFHTIDLALNKYDEYVIDARNKLN